MVVLVCMIFHFSFILNISSKRHKFFFFVKMRTRLKYKDLRIVAGLKFFYQTRKKIHD